MMATFQKGKTAPQVSGDTFFSTLTNQRGFYHQHSANSSTDTVIHHPRNPKENTGPQASSVSSRSNTQPPGLRTVRLHNTGLGQVIGHTGHNPAHTFDISITQKPNWELPESIKQVLAHQAKVYAEPKPKEASEATKARLAKHKPDPKDGKRPCLLLPKKTF